jgi:F0F1-type ATP synthase, alpha subunit
MTLTLLTNLEGQFGGSEDESSIVFSAEDFAQSSEKVRQRVSILVNKNIPLTPYNLRKIQIPLPVASESERKRRLALQHVDDLISMSDGQIWLDENLYNKGQRPAIDAQRSITRVGIGADTKSRADAPALRSLAGGLRFDFAQADNLDGAGTNSGVDKQIMKKKAYLLAMHQEPGEERTLSENCVAMMAASMRLLDGTIRDGHVAGTKDGQATVRALIEHVSEVAPDAMAEIDTTLDMSQSVKKVLETAIQEYFT